MISRPLLVLGIWIFLSCPAMAVDKEGKAESVTVKTKEGLHFTLPADWPVQRRNGVVTPVPIEEYLAQKFSAIEKRLQALENQTASMDLRLRLMEEEMKKQQHLRSAEGSSS